MLPNRQFANHANQGHEDGLTAQQAQKIIYFLKSRFEHLTIQEIVHSLVRNQQILTQSGKQNPVEAHRQNLIRAQENGQTIPPLPRTRYTHNSRIQPPKELRENVPTISAESEKRMLREQQIKTAARLFLGTGYDFKTMRHFYPQITQQQYRTDIDHICGQVITAVQQQLRLQHHIMVEHLSAEQRRVLRHHMFQVKDWLPKKSPGIFETFCKYVEMIFDIKQSEIKISYDEALRLYKVFLDISKSSYVDIQQIINDEEDDRNTPAYVGQEARPVPLSTFTQEEKKIISELYLKHKDVMKVNKQLNRIIGGSKKWKKESLVCLLKDLIKRSLVKIISARKKYLQAKEIHFETTQEFIQRLFQLKQLEPLRVQLLKFNLAGRVSTSGLTGIINKLNGYYSDSDLAQEETQDSEASSMFKLEQTMKVQEPPRRKPRREQTKIQTIDLEEDDKNSVATAEPQAKQEIHFDESNYLEHIQIPE